MNFLASSLRPVAAAALCLTLAACGGGGDGCSACGLLASVQGTPVSNTPAAPADAPPSAPEEGQPPASTDVPPIAVPEPPAEDIAPPAPVEPTPPRYAIRGVLAGLAANTRLVLLDNGGDALTLSANGAFGFAAPVTFNTAYSVTVGTQPLWQNCSASNGSGTATADVANVQVDCVEAQGQVTTLAGSLAQGYADGTGAAALFNVPQAIAVDRSGYLYVADSDNNMIRKVTPDGVVTTFAGSAAPGSANGIGSAAQFSTPDGIAVDANGNVFVAEYGNDLIRKITPDGVVTTFAGSTTGSADGTGTNAQFAGPSGLAFDASGNLYVADYGNCMIRKITPEGVVTTLAGSTRCGFDDGIGAAASFRLPNAVKVDAAGNVYVADSRNNAIRKITPEGVVTTLAGSGARGAADGTGPAASFDGPIGMGIDASGYLYVADVRNNTIRKVTPDGVVTTLAGSGTAGSADGIGTAAQFAQPFDVAVDASGTLYVLCDMIRKITPVR